MPRQMISEALEVMERSPGPSKVVENVMGCDVVVSDGLPVVETPLLKKIAPPLVTEPLMVDAPSPFWVKFPETLQVAATVRRPALDKRTGPAAVVVKVLLRVMALVTSWMPVIVLILVVPFKVVVPVPDCWVRAAVVNPLKVALRATAMSRVPSRVPAPTAAWKVVSSRPLVIDRF